MRLSFRKKGRTIVRSSLLLAGALLLALPLTGRVHEQPEQALKAVFPGAEVKRKPVYLSKEEQSELSEESGVRLESRFYTFYEAKKNGKVVGYGTFYTDVVRTKEQTLFVAVDARHRVMDVRLISFFEPEEYHPPRRWLDILKGKGQSDAIRPGKDLPAMSGATLTARACADTTRMILAIVKRKF